MSYLLNTERFYFFNENKLYKSFVFRKDINALRAIAVLMVLLTHINKSFLPSGYLGVDIFFVISGFVVTLSFLKSVKYVSSTKELILSFFARRFKRLYPALLSCVLINIIFYMISINPYIWLTRSELNSGISSLFGLSNIYFLKTQLSYFGDEFSYNPFLHTWSLGVEEQFYLLFPFLFIFIIKISKGSIKKIILNLLFAATLSIVFFFLSHYFINNSYSFFLSPFRFWEMILGSVTYFFCIHLNPNGKVLNFLNTLTFILIIGLAFIPSSNFSPNLVFITCIFTCINILSFNNENQLSRLLSINLIQKLGSSSYSIYLYHWPLIVYAKWFFPSNFLAQIIFGLFSIPIGYLSYNFIELRFIRARKEPLYKNKFFRNFKRLFLILIPSILILGISNINYRIYKSFSNLKIAYPNPGLKSKYLKCNLKNSNIINEKSNKFSKKIVLFGDSHAMHLLPMVKKAFSRTESNSIFVSDLLTNNKACNKEEIKSLIKFLKLKKGDLFITSFHRGRLSSNELATIGDRADVYHWDPAYESIKNKKTEQVIQKLVFLALELDKINVPLILFLDTPTSMVQLNTNICSLSASLGRETPCNINSIIDLKSRSRNDYVVNEVIKISYSNNIRVYSFDPYEIISEKREKFEPFDSNGQPLLNDGHHLTYQGAIKLTKPFQLFLNSNNLGKFEVN